MFHVYIIQSQINNSLYIGQTRDLHERIIRHNQGRSNYTKSKRPWKILFSEKFDTRSQAIKKESKFKSLKRKDLLLKFIRSAG